MRVCLSSQALYRDLDMIVSHQITNQKDPLLHTGPVAKQLRHSALDGSCQGVGCRRVGLCGLAVVDGGQRRDSQTESGAPGIAAGRGACGGRGAGTGGAVWEHRVLFVTVRGSLNNNNNNL